MIWDNDSLGSTVGIEFFDLEEKPIVCFGSIDRFPLPKLRHIIEKIYSSRPLVIRRATNAGWVFGRDCRFLTIAQFVTSGS